MDSKKTTVVIEGEGEPCTIPKHGIHFFFFTGLLPYNFQRKETQWKLLNEPDSSSPTTFPSLSLCFTLATINFCSAPFFHRH